MGEAWMVDAGRPPRGEKKCTASNAVLAAAWDPEAATRGEARRSPGA